MILFFLAPFLLGIPALGSWVVASHQDIARRSQADARAADIAEAVSERIAVIHRMNAWFETMRVECLTLVAADPSVLPRIRAESQVALMTQEYEMVRLRASIVLYITEGTIAWAPRTRGLPRECGIPAPLILSDNLERIFDFQSLLAGIRISARSTLERPAWRYHHPLLSEGAS